MIPIVLLHHDQADILLKTVRKICENTRYPYILFVVDNSSPESNELGVVFSEIVDVYNVVLIKNNNNNWIYGFNLAMKHALWPQSKYYAFSDADILVPKLHGKCWLECLVEEMDINRCIGKLGLSLDISQLAFNRKMKETYEMELKYQSGDKIGNNIIAPVDTTMALYRCDYFVFKFKFRIGHQSLFRPYYYTCRTKKELTAIHVGWDFYPNMGNKSYSEVRNYRKSLSMCKMGTYVAPEIFDTLKVYQRIYLKCLKLMVRFLHSIKISALNFLYLLSHFPRKINEIQDKAR